MVTFSLKKKLLLLLTISVISFGSINIFLFHTLLQKWLLKMLMDEGKVLSLLFTQESLPLILAKDVNGTKLLAKRYLERDSKIVYIFVYDSEGNVWTSTYDNNPPQFLDKCSKLDEVKYFKSDNLYFQDIQTKILDGSWGYLRIGVSENPIRNAIKKGDLILLMMVIVFFIAGFIGSFIISEDVSTAVNKVVKAMESFDVEKEIPTMPVKRKDEIGIIARNLNITFEKLKKLDRENRDLLLKMREMDKLSMVSILGGGLSHEINNPLSAMLISLDRIIKDPANKEQTLHYAKSMKESISHIKDVVGNLLSFVRKKRGVSSYSTIEEALKKSEALLGFYLKDFNINLERDFSSKKYAVKIDMVQLVQVFINLILNSVKAIEKGGVIKIGCYENGNFVFTTVSDNGKGMDDQTIEKVFDPFFTTYPDEGGTGLGLSICKTIIEENGGQIEIKSKIGVGTDVTFSLPKVDM